jgi:hypothetical protein
MDGVTKLVTILLAVQQRAPLPGCLSSSGGAAAHGIDICTDVAMCMALQVAVSDHRLVVVIAGL